MLPFKAVIGPQLRVTVRRSRFSMGRSTHPSSRSSDWHLYYAAWDGAFLETAPNQKRFTTCLAESDDGGMTWRHGERPLLELGRPHAPDEHGTGSCAVVHVGGKYWKYYRSGGNVL